MGTFPSRSEVNDSGSSNKSLDVLVDDYLHTLIGTVAVLSFGMSEEEFEREWEADREEIADHLEAFASSLRGGDDVEVDMKGTTMNLDMPEVVNYEVEVEDEMEEEGLMRSIELELEWVKREDEDADLEDTVE
jgi:amphi-Trp domain-containing protein